MFSMLAWTGGLTDFMQTTMYALAAHVYPTSVRATGVGTADGSPHIGECSARPVGSWALEAGGPARFFGLTAARTMTLTLIALASSGTSHSRAVIGSRAAFPVAAPAGH